MLQKPGINLLLKFILKLNPMCINVTIHKFTITFTTKVSSKPKPGTEAQGFRRERQSSFTTLFGSNSTVV